MNKHVAPQINRRTFVIGTAAVGTGLALGLEDRKSTRLNSSHRSLSRMPSSA